ncbi:MAG TPA: peptide deformylase [Candidatus Paceibacterota bacterium]
MTVPILQKEDKILRKKSEEVPVGDIALPKIHKIIADMKEAMHGEPDAVAIAAPQIGVNLRIFVVAGRAFNIMKKESVKSKVESKSENKKDEKMPEDQIFINPKITKLSKETKSMEEGCLSVRYLYGKVRRSTKATVEAYNEKGEKIKRGGSGLLAQIFQHETDHLEGKLFIDKATDVIDLPPKEREEWKKKNR